MEKANLLSRAVIYIRVVTDGVIMEEIDTQRIACELYSKEQGYELAGVYTDKGATGSHTDRPAMNDLRADAAAGKFDRIIVFDTSRIARNVLAARAFLDEMQRHGVAVESVKEPKGVVMLCHQ